MLLDFKEKTRAENVSIRSDYRGKLYTSSLAFDFRLLFSHSFIFLFFIFYFQIQLSLEVRTEMALLSTLVALCFLALRLDLAERSNDKLLRVQINLMFVCQVAGGKRMQVQKSGYKKK